MNLGNARAADCAGRLSRSEELAGDHGSKNRRWGTRASSFSVETSEKGRGVPRERDSVNEGWRHAGKARMEEALPNGLDHTPQITGFLAWNPSSRPIPRTTPFSGSPCRPLPGPLPSMPRHREP